MDEPADDSQDRAEEAPLNVEELCAVFRTQLIACLQECARGRIGLFSDAVAEEGSWTEAEQLRALAVALHSMMQELRIETASSALIEQYLDLCSMHGESHPGEARLARQFLEWMEQNGERPPC